MFVNRTKEMQLLDEEFTHKGARFIVIYGRRRVGKTRLIEEFIKDKDSVYYLAALESEAQQIKELKTLIGRKLNDELILTLELTDWKQLFSYLEKILPKDKKMIIVIDEVTFLIKNNSSFVSYLQKFWDQFLSKTNIILILSGSLVGLIIKEILAEESPLYGRRTAQIQLEPLLFSHSIEFMKTTFEESIALYSVTGGIPQYLLQIDQPFIQFLKKKFFYKDGFFYQEGQFLLSQEFKDPSTYIDILKAISFGNTKLNEISNFTGIETKILSRYVDILIELRLMKRIVPITEDKDSYRGAIYKINDNFLSFWHHFVFPNRSSIEIENEEDIKRIMREVNSYIGFVFEDICKQFLITNQPISFTNIGTWWDKENEIDIVAYHHTNKEIFFCECKWKESVNSDEILFKLQQKSTLVQWNNQSRKEYFVIFAKSFKNKNQHKNVFLFDLKDIEKKMKRN